MLKLQGSLLVCGSMSAAGWKVVGPKEQVKDIEMIFSIDRIKPWV